MKTFATFLSIALATAAVLSTSAQEVNWAAVREGQSHLVNVNAGWGYASTLGAGYGYILKTKLPMSFTVQFTLPAGKNLLDDFKVTAGGEIRVLSINGFMTSVSLMGIYRRYESDLGLLNNFGSDMGITTGYYKERWYAAGEFGFDKAIATKVINSDLMKKYFPEAKDGWYVPTGGNFRYGFKGGYSFKGADVYAKGGWLRDQNFEATALVPYYLFLGVNARF
jgi:hypothetical protein